MQQTHPSPARSLATSARRVEQPGPIRQVVALDQFGAGSSPTLAIRRFSSALTSVDLPTLARPSSSPQPLQRTFAMRHQLARLRQHFRRLARFLALTGRWRARRPERWNRPARPRSRLGQQDPFVQNFQRRPLPRLTHGVDHGVDRRCWLRRQSTSTTTSMSASASAAFAPPPCGQGNQLIAIAAYFRPAAAFAAQERPAADSSFSETYAFPNRDLGAYRSSFLIKWPSSPYKGLAFAQNQSSNAPHKIICSRGASACSRSARPDRPRPVPLPAHRCARARPASRRRPG